MQVLFLQQAPEQAPFFRIVLVLELVGEIGLRQDGRQLPVAWMVVAQTARFADKNKMDLLMVSFCWGECEYENECRFVRRVRKIG